jgi:transcriptional regulator with XRE-family HTH domain
MKIKQIVGDNIRFIREKKGWVQEDLSIVSKISRTYLSEIERGLKSPTIVTLEKIAKALKVSVAILVTPKAYQDYKRPKS